VAAAACDDGDAGAMVAAGDRDFDKVFEAATCVIYYKYKYTVHLLQRIWHSLQWISSYFLILCLVRAFYE
jgi:hypothetical protein